MSEPVMRPPRAAEERSPRRQAGVGAVRKPDTKNPPDLDRAIRKLERKQRPYTELWRYYDGEARMPVLVNRLKEILKGFDLYIAENWCEVVIGALYDRITLKALTCTDRVAQAELERIFADSEVALEAMDAHLAAGVIGESYIIAWPDPEAYDGRPLTAEQLAEGEAAAVFPDADTGDIPAIDVCYHDPRLVHLFYDPENPKRKQYAAKWWDDADGMRRVTLYYPDRIEHYVSEKAIDDDVESIADVQFDLLGEEPNPYGEVPVFHLRPERRRVKSDLQNVVPIQNAINILLINMLVASEFNALPQKYAVTNADLSQLTNSPNTVQEIPKGDAGEEDTQVGAWPAAQLSGFLEAIDKLASTLSIITRIPKHYFYGQGGDPSGEALVALEAPLNKRASDRIERFTPTWKELGRFLLKLRGVRVPRSAMGVAFARPETVQPKAKAEIRKIEKDTGLPLFWLLKREGMTEKEIEELKKFIREEAADQAASLAAALVEQQRRLDQERQGQEDGRLDQERQGQEDGRLVAGLQADAAAGGVARG